MTFALSLVIFVFGASIGSFLNVVILRLPYDKHLGGRSHCPHCKYTLTPWDLIPVLSYVLLRGKCRKCKKPISSRYAGIEVITGLLFVLAFTVITPSEFVAYIELIRAWMIIATLIVVFVVDLEHYLILDKVVFPAFAMLLGLTVALDIITQRFAFALHSITVSGLIAGVAAGGLFFLLWALSRGKAMGLGDAKLLLFVGLALGWPEVWVMLLLSFFLGTLYAVPLLVTGKKQLSSRVPFGTFLTLATLVVLLWGPWIISLYFAAVYKIR